jgi:hypothetical protein
MSKYRVMRERLGLNQSEFWARVGVTQSGGSRYESGRTPGKPVQMLIALAYGPAKEKASAMRILKL